MIRGEASALCYYAFDLDAQEAKTSDGANHVVQLSIDGGAFTSLTVGTITELGGGVYRVNLSTSETNCKIGILAVSSSTAQVIIAPVQFSPGLPAPSVPTASQNAAAVWQDATSGDFTVLNSIGKRLTDNVDAAISTRSTYAGGAVASVTGAVGSVTDPVTISDKTGFKLAADGLDSVSATATAGSPTTISGKLNQIHQRLFGKGVKSTDGSFKVYLDNGTDVMTTQNWTDSGTGDETLSAAT